MAFTILYHEDALADLEETFEWSREKHPETTEQFANDLFDRLELLQATGWTRIGEPLKSSTSGTSPEKTPLSKNMELLRLTPPCAA